MEDSTTIAVDLAKSVFEVAVSRERRTFPLPFRPTPRKLPRPGPSRALLRLFPSPRLHHQARRRVPAHSAHSRRSIRPARGQTHPAPRLPPTLGSRPPGSPRSQQGHHRSGKQARSHRLGRLVSQSAFPLQPSSSLIAISPPQRDRSTDEHSPKTTRGQAGNTQGPRGRAHAIGSPCATLILARRCSRSPPKGRRYECRLFRSLCRAPPRKEARIHS